MYLWQFSVCKHCWITIAQSVQKNVRIAETVGVRIRKDYERGLSIDCLWIAEFVDAVFAANAGVVPRPRPRSTELESRRADFHPLRRPFDYDSVNLYIAYNAYMGIQNAG